MKRKFHSDSFASSALLLTGDAATVNRMCKDFSTPQVS